MIEKDGTVTVGVDTTKQEHLSTGLASATPFLDD